MKFKQLLAATLLPLGGLITAPAAHADTVLYDGSGFLVGTQSFVKSFNLTAPGTLTVTLTNVAWPEQLASLNLLMSSTSGAMGSEMAAGTETFGVKNGALGSEMAAGTETFDVKSGAIFARWFGTAQGPLNAGVFSLKIDFKPNVVGAVPIPTSIALLLSGLALLLWHRRQRGTEASDAEDQRNWCV